MRVFLVAVAAAASLLCAPTHAEYCLATPPSPPAAAGAPNFVFVLTDDLDQSLGSTQHALPKTIGHFHANGATANNFYIHTPVCCPSRAELLTGRYFHNLKTEKHKGGCMGVNVTASNTSAFYGDYYFAPHFQQAGYTVGIFGKHLNSQNTQCPPPGVDVWFANGGGDYYSPAFTWATAGQAGKPETVKFQNCSGNGRGDQACYSTTVIGEQAQAWLKRLNVTAPDKRKPFFAYVAFKAPHIQDGSGWPVPLVEHKYNNSFAGVQAPRNPNFNFTAVDHHWMIRTQPPLTAEQEARTDELYRQRLRALLTVDDQVEQLLATVGSMGVRENTYFVFSSDHGYRFGQFGMAMGKWNVYENDVRIPFLISGPHIARNTSFDQIASQVDTMPTMLGLANVSLPATMDGLSLAPFLRAQYRHQQQERKQERGGATPTPTEVGQEKEKEKAEEGEEEFEDPGEWRTEQLIEYQGLGTVVRYEHLCDTTNNTFRALRILDPSAQSGRRNLKYVEFVDDAVDWTWSGPILEYELFDLDADPYETKNLYAAYPDKSFLTHLHDRLDQLYHCRGRGVDGKPPCN